MREMPIGAMLRHVSIICGALACLLITSIAAVTVLPSIQFPSGSRSVPGISATVALHLDRFGVPHVEARTREDAFAALGYMTGRDRLFQMDMMRRKTAGRLAEIYGETLVEEDRLNRTFGFSHLADSIVARLPEPQKAVLQAYSNGVNRAMSDMLILPFEFWALNYRPERWSPKDSILVALNLATLSYAVEQERTATVMRETLPPAVVKFLTPDGDCYNEMLAPSGADFCIEHARPPAELRELLRRTEKGAAHFETVHEMIVPRGSNAWVVSRSKTRDGRAIVANDMHLLLELPNIWYQADVRYGPHRMEGLLLPGLPLIIAGSNGNVAWGLTSVDGDFSDLIRLRKDPSDHSRYASPEGFQAFSSRSEHISVRGKGIVSFEIRDTKWGPVLPQPLLGEEVALRWTMLEASATNLNLLDLDGVRTVREALPVLQSAGTPPLNGLVADDRGSIGWTLLGKIPNRRGLSGIYSEYWDSGEIGWEGFLQPSNLPTIIDPAEGYIVSTNQRMLPTSIFSTRLSQDYPGGYRAWRVHDALSGSSQVGIDDMVALQLDTKTDFYRFYQDVAIRALKQSALANEPDSAALIASLESWDGRAETHSKGLALIAEFRQTLLQEILSPIFEECRRLDPDFAYNWSNADVPLQAIIRSGDASLLPKSEYSSDWSAFLRGALIKSAKRIEAPLGRPISEITWGDVNHVEIAHPFSKVAPLLSMFLNMSRSPVAGCSQCVRLYAVEGGNTVGANVRTVIAPGKEQESLIQFAGGQSGQFGSSHYADREKDWVAGQGAPLRSTEIVSTILLTPPSIQNIR